MQYNMIRVSSIEQISESTIPISKVIPKPFNAEAPNEPTIISITAPKMVVMLPSIIAPAERLKPSAHAVPNALPAADSSFILSKIMTFASTAIPIESSTPAIPESVSCTHGNTASRNR